jgi:hypothetical protein
MIVPRRAKPPPAPGNDHHPERVVVSPWKASFHPGLRA